MIDDIDIVTTCARVLLATTKAWRAADGNAATLADARALIAAVFYAQGGRGFSQPASTDDAADPNLRAAWSSCVAAARSAKVDNDTSPSSISHVFLWTPDPDNPAKLGDRQKLQLNWPFLAGSHIDRVSGPLLVGDANEAKRLFFFSVIDPAALELDGGAPPPGFWPKAGMSQSAPNPSTPTPIDQNSQPQRAPASTRPWLAGVMFASWAFLTVYSATWTWFAVKFAQMDQKTWSQQLDWVKNLFWYTLSPRGPGFSDFSFMLPMLTLMLSIILLVLSAGLARKGLWFGAMIDDRKRLSLSRVQQVAWSVILLGGLGALAVFRTVLFGVNQVDELFPHDDLFPHMDPALWAALGINLAVTPFLSASILASKDTIVATDQRQATDTHPLVTPAKLDRKDSSSDASWIDLISGETAGTDKTIDVSRLQYLIISFILILIIFVGLSRIVEHVKIIDLIQHADCIKPVKVGAVCWAPGSTKMKSVFANMPSVSTTFLGLLAFSHVSYLTFKARARLGNDADTAPKTETRTLTGRNDPNTGDLNP